MSKQKNIKMKKALITGVMGQDGSYLSKLLLEKGYKVYGATRRNGSGSDWRHEYLGIKNEVEIIDFELLEQTNIQLMDMNEHVKVSSYNIIKILFISFFLGLYIFGISYEKFK